MTAPQSETLPPHLNPVLEFMRLLWAVDHGLQSMSKRMEMKLGVTGPQRLVLRFVGQFPGISAGRLADLLHLHPSTLTGVLTRLEEAGFLKRRPDPEDRRRALFVLSPRGTRLNSSSTSTVEGRLKRLLARQPSARVEAARLLLSALSEELLKSR